MTSGMVAALTAGLALVFVEGLGHVYPTKASWLRIRSRHGRRVARKMRQRCETYADRGTPRWLTILLFGLVGGWIASASLLDKRWWEVALDVVPYVFVGSAFIRLPAVMHKIAERMRRYERDLGEDPDTDLDEGDGGVAVIAL